MTEFEKRIKLIAHYAVQQELQFEVESEHKNTWDKNGKHVVASELQLRKLLLDALEAHGYKRFIVSKDNESFSIEPVVMVGRDNQEEGSWQQTDVYNVAEIEAFLNYIGERCILTASNTQVLEYAQEKFEMPAMSAGPGCKFRNKSYVYQARNRIVVKHSGGIDC